MEQLQFLTPPDKIKRCPSCRSIYIEDDFCEACGLQLNYRMVGIPMGRKSFYSIVERHWDDNSRLLEPFFPSLKKDLNRVLLIRFRVLVQYFQDGGDEDHRKFLVEFDHLTTCLLERRVDGLQLLSRIPRESGLYQRVGNFVAWRMQKKTLFDKILELRLGSTFQVSSLFLFLGISVLMIFGALAYFRYYFAIL